jgi:CheY-like chemotaxis protein
VLKVLVLQEKAENVFNIREALPDCEIQLFDHVSQAIQAINREDFDLIVSAVHLEHDGSVFDFLKTVKTNIRFHHIPFVFYCSKSSTFARSVRHGLQIAAHALGAEKYITMEHYDRDILRDELISVLDAYGLGRDADRETAEHPAFDELDELDAFKALDALTPPLTPPQSSSQTGLPGSPAQNIEGNA